LARNVTLSQLRTDIADQADITGAVGASSRYTPTQLNRLINQSIQRFREKISNEGATRYLVSATGSLAVGATSPYPFYVLDLSAVSPSIVRTYGLDITVNNVVRTLKHVPFTRRGEYGGPNYTGIPEAWAHYVGNKLAIFPPSSGTYTYVCWYLPVLDDLSSDLAPFDGVSGWEDFIVWDCVCRLIIKDQYPQAFQMATSERDRVWTDIVRQATRVSSEGGAFIGRDTMGEEMRLTSATSRSRNLPPP
jgi:hypothetical protein